MSWSALVPDVTPLRGPGAHGFRAMFTSRTVAYLGSQAAEVALLVQAQRLTGSPFVVGTLGLAELVPLIVFGLYGGALADHFDRRLLMVISTAGLIGTSALFWLQSALGNSNVWLLLTLFAVQQAFFAINSPTRSAILPKLLPAALLPAANSLFMTVLQAGAIAGPLRRRFHLAEALLTALPALAPAVVDVVQQDKDQQRRSENEDPAPVDVMFGHGMPPLP